MWEFVQQLSPWNWLALGTLLLILEVFGAGGYLLWIGLAAVSVGILSFVVGDIPWSAQFVAFGLLSVVTVWLWHRHQQRTSQSPSQAGLNQRGSELLGREFPLHEAISRGRGKIKAGDSLWLVSGADMPAGSNVRVVGQEGVILLVENAAQD
ncbi:NfeD family protein [Pseudomonas sp. 5P_3.1_Bac2]|uniref:NfeD family protein n=1 Tax=Pseudomonas sp. 5P_3.1_Bac2 TaxID=2971617 RepID=UPI0021C93B60|nr:NfeD family protein [Pseudomonas sp. 5P_3.1_Bac2]MCU1718505.1 NfeD family protein [Pseudomonas sp. 5P_3.1_Bac2]